MSEKYTAGKIVPSSGMPLQADYDELETNAMLGAFKRNVHEDKVGVDHTKESFQHYHKIIKEADRRVLHDPSILDEYQVSLSDKKPHKSLMNAVQRSRIDWEDRILYYRANPWLLAWDIIGLDQIQLTVPRGTEFRGFFKEQKEFLRDFMDPRVERMVIRCSRGGSKTFLIGMGIVAAEYLIPKIRITVNSGSLEQSQKVYEEYFKPFVERTPIENILAGNITKRLTRFKHVGWVKVLTASFKSLKGGRPDIYVLDEACSTDDQAIVEGMGGAWTAHNLKFIVSSTPDSMGGKFFDINEKSPENGWKLYHWNMHDCPWVPERNIEIAMEELDYANQQITIMGEFAARTGCVWGDIRLVKFAEVDEYPEHVLEWLEDHSTGGVTQTSIGVDWGTAHPTCVVTSGIDDGGMGYVLDSFGASQMRTPKMRDHIIERVHKYEPSHLLADSENLGENKELRYDLYKAETGMGVQAMAFGKYKMRMINEVRNRLEKQTIQICPKYGHNKTLLSQMMKYTYKPSTIETDGVSSKPSKKDDDYIDALIQSMWPLKRSSVYVSKSKDSGVRSMSLPTSSSWNSRRDIRPFSGRKIA